MRVQRGVAVLYKPCGALSTHFILQLLPSPPLISVFATEALLINTSHDPTAKPCKPELVHPSVLVPHGFHPVFMNNPNIASSCQKPQKSLESMLSLTSNLHSGLEPHLFLFLTLGSICVCATVQTKMHAPCNSVSQLPTYPSIRKNTGAILCVRQSRGWQAMEG